MKAMIAGSAAALVSFGAASAHAQQCRAFDAGAQIASLADARINEASGLATSWRNDGLFWTHNDSGDDARVFGVDANGATRVVLEFPDIVADDWEDVAVGPCSPGESTPCVWVGDIGDNNEVRPSISLVRFEEPTIDDQTPATLQLLATSIPVTYEGGPRNAETLMVHPIDGRVFIVDKTVGDPSNLWLVPTDGSTPATMVASTPLGETGIVSGRITGGDFAPDGAEFSVRTYTHIYTFCGADPVLAFEAERSSVIGTHLFQSEALTYSRDGARLFTTTEVQTTEAPALLEMQLVAPPTVDMGMAATDAGSDASGPGPDVGSPTRDMNAAAPDVTVRLLDEPASGCTCRTARTKQAEHPWVLGLLALAAMFRRRFRAS